MRAPVPADFAMRSPLFLVVLAMVLSFAAPHTVEAARRRTIPSWRIQDPRRVPADHSAVPIPVFQQLEISGLSVRARTEESLPFIDVTLFVKAVPDAPNVTELSLLTAAMLKWGGTIGKEGAAFQSFLAQSGLELTAVTRPDYLELRLKGSADRLALALNILADLVLTPAYPQEVLDKVREQLRGQLEARADDALSATLDRLNFELLGPHPFARSARPEVADKVTREILGQFHAYRFGSNRAMLSVFSPLEPEVLRGYLVRAFSGWKAAPESGAMPEIPAPQEQAQSVQISAARGAAVGAGRLLSLEDDESRVAALVLAQLLEDQLRAKLHAGGHEPEVGSSLTNWSGSGMLRVWASGSTPAPLDEALAHTLARAAAGDFSLHQIELARAAATARLLKRLDGMPEILKASVEQELRGLDPSGLIYQLQQLRTMSARELLEMSKKLTGSGAFTTVSCSAGRSMSPVGREFGGSSAGGVNNEGEHSGLADPAETGHTATNPGHTATNPGHSAPPAGGNEHSEGTH